MKVHQLFEAKSISPGAEALKDWILANVQLPPVLAKKNPMFWLWTKSPYRVWTRGDGYRYKEAPYVEFSRKEYADLAWAEMLKLPHEQITLLGPFGSERHEAYIIGPNIYIKGPDKIYTYRKASVEKSKVMSIDPGTDNLLLSIIEKKLQSKKPIRIHLPRIDTVGEIIGVDDRELTIKQDDGTTRPLLLQRDADIRYTIKDIGGIPTLVKK